MQCQYFCLSFHCLKPKMSSARKSYRLSSWANPSPALRSSASPPWQESSIYYIIWTYSLQLIRWCAFSLAKSFSNYSISDLQNVLQQWLFLVMFNIDCCFPLNPCRTPFPYFQAFPGVPCCWGLRHQVCWGFYCYVKIMSKLNLCYHTSGPLA